MGTPEPPATRSDRYWLSKAQFDRATGTGLVGSTELRDGAVTIGDTRLPITAQWLRRAVDSGVIDEDAPVELLNGELVIMTPASPQHSSMVRKLCRHLYGLLDASEFGVFIQMPIELGELSRPEPDLTVARGPESDYVERDPTAPDVLLVVEVSSTSLARDRNEKLPLYAKAGIREMWIVNLAECAIEVHRDPHLGRYQWTRSFDGGILTPHEPTLSRLEVNVGALF